MQRIPVYCDDQGITRIDKDKGHMVDVALGWKDVDAFKDLIVERMTKD